MKDTQKDSTVQDSNIKTYIAVGVVVLIFVPVLGLQLFPQIFPFDIFQSNFIGGSNVPAGVGEDAAPIELGGLADPVTILDLEIGEGAVAEQGKTVLIGYVGTRLDPDTGEEIIFDQNTDRASAFSFVLGSGMVIPGFDIGVTGMREGGKRLVIISPEMGYGDQQAGSIPPNTTLHFMIELYEVKQ